MKPKEKHIEIKFEYGHYHNVSSQRSKLHNIKETNKMYVGRQLNLLYVIDKLSSQQKKY